MKQAIDIRQVAKVQRQLLWFILAQLLAYVVVFAPIFRVPPGVMTAVTVVQFALAIVQVILVIKLLSAKRRSLVVIVLYALLMFAPCVNLLILVLINNDAVKILRRAGIRVGFMGADLAEVERMVDRALCKGCGYNLTGNVSGVCSECGLAISAS